MYKPEASLTRIGFLQSTIRLTKKTKIPPFTQLMRSGNLCCMLAGASAVYYQLEYSGWKVDQQNFWPQVLEFLSQRHWQPFSTKLAIDFSTFGQFLGNWQKHAAELPGSVQKNSTVDEIPSERSPNHACPALHCLNVKKCKATLTLRSNIQYLQYFEDIALNMYMQISTNLQQQGADQNYNFRSSIDMFFILFLCSDGILTNEPDVSDWGKSSRKIKRIQPDAHF